MHLCTSAPAGLPLNRQSYKALWKEDLQSFEKVVQVSISSDSLFSQRTNALPATLEIPPLQRDIKVGDSDPCFPKII